MELKLGSLIISRKVLVSSNCTFMELKFIYYIIINMVFGVLIVPLWN